MKIVGWLIMGAVLLVVVAAVAGGGDDKSTSGDADSSADTKAKSCGTRATSDCTPNVGVGKSIRVDALYWRVRAARLAATTGNSVINEKAAGTFVVVTVRVKSDRNESATITSDMAKLIAADGTSYDPDTDAMIGLDDSLILEEIGPDSTIVKTLVYDLPSGKAASKRLKLRVGELGLGEGHGFIRLPQPA